MAILLMTIFNISECLADTVKQFLRLTFIIFERSPASANSRTMFSYKLLTDFRKKHKRDNMIQ